MGNSTSIWAEINENIRRIRKDYDGTSHLKREGKHVYSDGLFKPLEKDFQSSGSKTCIICEGKGWVYAKVDYPDLDVMTATFILCDYCKGEGLKNKIKT